MAELIYKQLKKDLEQKAIVAADPATTAMVVTKSEFITYKDQTEQTLQTMKDATTKAQETVDNVIQGHTPLKGLVVYRDDIADNNGIAITENQDSNLAIYKVNQDGSPSDVKLLLNGKEVAMKSNLDNYAKLNENNTFTGTNIFNGEFRSDTLTSVDGRKKISFTEDSVKFNFPVFCQWEPTENYHLTNKEYVDSKASPIKITTLMYEIQPTDDPNRISATWTLSNIKPENIGSINCSYKFNGGDYKFSHGAMGDTSVEYEWDTDFNRLTAIFFKVQYIQTIYINILYKE